MADAFEGGGGLQHRAVSVNKLLGECLIFLTFSKEPPPPETADSNWNMIIKCEARQQLSVAPAALLSS